MSGGSTPRVRWSGTRALAGPRLLPASRRAARTQPRLPGARAQAAQTLLPHPQRPRRGGTRARMSFPRARTPLLKPMHRSQLPALRCRHARVDGLQRLSGRLALPQAETPSPSCRRPGANPRSWTEISMGTRAHTTPIAPTRRLRARPPGDRTPELALTHNETAEPTRPPPTTSPTGA